VSDKNQTKIKFVISFNSSLFNVKVQTVKHCYRFSFAFIKTIIRFACKLIFSCRKYNREYKRNKIIAETKLNEWEKLNMLVIFEVKTFNCKQAVYPAIKVAKPEFCMTCFLTFRRDPFLMTSFGHVSCKRYVLIKEKAFSLFEGKKLNKCLMYKIYFSKGA
jgi:hypothetical protein